MSDRFAILPGERLDPLNGEGLFVLQKPGGYCFSMDAVLLSHFAAVRPGELAADLGTGSGVIPLLLCTREKTLRVYGLELDAETADRARRSVLGNHLSGRIQILTGDIRSLPAELPLGQFHLVVCNPPYGNRTDTRDSRTLAVTEAACTLSDAVRAARRLLRFSGRFCFCYPADRLQTALTILSEHRFALKRLRLVHTLPGKPAYLFLAEAVLGGREGVQVLPPLTVRDGQGHETPELLAIYGQNHP